MISRSTMLDYIGELLEIHRFDDYCPNGLQVEGKNEVGIIVTGVTASEQLIDAAIDLNADALLVHHGYFWRGENPTVVSMKQRRLKKLLLNNINLLAYHLPLDAHSKLGNNARLAQLFELSIVGRVQGTGKPEIAFVAEVDEPVSLSDMAIKIEERLQRKPLVITGNDRPIKTVGICSGAAQNYIEQAISAELDLYISGEISEHTVHMAREMGINYIAAGHHATERYGIQSLGEHLAEKFSIQHHFIDIDNPV